MAEYIKSILSFCQETIGILIDHTCVLQRVLVSIIEIKICIVEALVVEYRLPPSSPFHQGACGGAKYVYNMTNK